MNDVNVNKFSSSLACSLLLALAAIFFRVLIISVGRRSGLKTHMDTQHRRICAGNRSHVMWLLAIYTYILLNAHHIDQRMRCVWIWCDALRMDTPMPYPYWRRKPNHHTGRVHTLKCTYKNNTDNTQ